MIQQPLPEPDDVLDTLGLYCPVPVWEAAKRLRTMPLGSILELLSDDEGIVDDMPTWCHRTGNEYIGLRQLGDQYRVFIRKVAP